MKLFLITTVLFAVILLRMGSLGQKYSCDPSEDCLQGNSTAGSKVPDPENCSQYYLCLDGGDGEIFPSDDPLSCPSGQYFDWDSEDCVEEDGTACKTLCTKLCDITCSEVGQSVADPRGCGYYYFCTENTDENRLEANCPTETPYFDGHNCQNDTSKCCNTCTPYCSDVYIETRDPLDCTKYYLCLTEGVPDEIDLHTCPEGQIFNAAIGRCVDGTDCEPLCSPSFFSLLFGNDKNPIYKF